MANANQLPCDEDGTLVLATHKTLRLHTSKGARLMDISLESGIPFYWLRRFHAQGSQIRPPANRIQHLYEYLSGQRLAV